MNNTLKNKILFLDHDGVICLSSEWGSRNKKQKKWNRRKLSMSIPLEFRFDNFNQKAIKVLNQILVETDVEIVISSDWRYHATLEEMGEYFELQGIIKKPIDFTPRTQDIEPEFWEKFSVSKSDIESERAFEIKYWLQQHPEVTHWVAIDDLDMSQKDETQTHMLENFVLTPKSNEGIKQSDIKEKKKDWSNNAL